MAQHLAICLPKPVTKLLHLESLTIGWTLTRSHTVLMTMTPLAALSGDFLLRHLRCCQANDQHPGWCEGAPQPVSATFHDVLSVLRSMPRPLRAAALCYARVGPDPKTPRTSWRTLARRQRSTHGSLLVLRQRARDAAALVEAALCR